MPAFRTLDNIALAGQRAVLRADLNVPVKNGKVTDQTRIVRLTPTIRELADKGARVVVISHFGRPNGKVVAEMSLAPLAEPLSAALGGKKVRFVPACVGAEAESGMTKLPGYFKNRGHRRFH